MDRILPTTIFVVEVWCFLDGNFGIFLWCLSSNEHHEMSVGARLGTRRSWILMVKLDWRTNFNLNLGSPSAKLIKTLIGSFTSC